MKKKMKLLIAILIAIFAMSSTIKSEAAVKVVKFKTTTTYKILKGEKLRLYVKGYKSNQKSKKVKWKSSNKIIATVSQKGVVTGKKGGTCKITATVKNKKYTTKIFVFTGENTVYEDDENPEEPADRYDINVTKINQEKKTLYVGQAFSLKITGTKKKITWKSSDSNIANVSSSGKVTAKSEGKVTITASFEDSSYVYKHTCKITVLPEWADAKTIEKSYGVEFLYYGDSIHILAASSSLTGMTNSALITDVPEIMEINVIYGDEIRYKYNGTDIFFNLSDLNNLDIID